MPDKIKMKPSKAELLMKLVPSIFSPPIRKTKKRRIKSLDTRLFLPLSLWLIQLIWRRNTVNAPRRCYSGWMSTQTWARQSKWGSLFRKKKIKKNRNCALCVICRELPSCESQLTWRIEEEKDNCGKNRYHLLASFWHSRSSFQDTDTCKCAHTHSILLLIFQICYFFNLK